MALPAPRVSPDLAIVALIQMESGPLLGASAF